MWSVLENCFLIDKFEHGVVWFCINECADHRGNEKTREIIVLQSEEHNTTEEQKSNWTASRDFHIHSIEHSTSAQCEEEMMMLSETGKLTVTEVLLLLLIELQIKIKRDWSSLEEKEKWMWSTFDSIKHSDLCWRRWDCVKRNWIWYWHFSNLRDFLFSWTDNYYSLTRRVQFV